jgi:Icc-related predicted phosphoesterase
MKIVVISDTHGQHGLLGPLSGDLLIHCGDFGLGESGADDTLQDLDDWFGRQHFRHILCTGGNHDFAVEERQRRGQRVFRHAVLLQDQTIEIDGLRCHGSPWVPELTQWAHYRSAVDLARAWAAIPGDVDLLITHTPPRGVLDVNSRGQACGCPLLRQRVAEIRPQAHCFGHIHASGGTTRVDGTWFVNASMVDHRYDLVRAPIAFDLAPTPARGR